METMGVYRTTRNAVRDVAKRYFPKAFARGRTLRYIATSRRAVDHGAGLEVARKCDWRISGGPFTGMKYPWWLTGSVLLGPKMLGCFEAELHDAFERVIRTGYRTVINVGSAEGYYTVGLALRMPNTTIVAYEADPVMRMLCADLAKLNGVSDRIEMKQWCGPAELASEPLDGAFVICDVEGYEMTLLDPDAVPGLRTCDFLVERHDGVDPKITPTLLERFATSHTAHVIDHSNVRDTEAGPLSGMAHDRRALATGEFRRNSRGWIEFLRK